MYFLKIPICAGWGQDDNLTQYGDILDTIRRMLELAGEGGMLLTSEGVTLQAAKNYDLTESLSEWREIIRDFANKNRLKWGLTFPSPCETHKNICQRMEYHYKGVMVYAKDLTVNVYKDKQTTEVIENTV